jgi:hypothetical protein
MLGSLYNSIQTNIIKILPFLFFERREGLVEQVCRISPGWLCRDAYSSVCPPQPLVSALIRGRRGGRPSAAAGRARRTPRRREDGLVLVELGLELHVLNLQVPDAGEELLSGTHLDF